jgi:hypothetical protein
VSYAEVAAAVRLAKALDEGQGLTVHGQVADGTTTVQFLNPFFVGIPTLGDNMTAFAKRFDQLVPSLGEGYTSTHGVNSCYFSCVLRVYSKHQLKQHIQSIDRFFA